MEVIARKRNSSGGGSWWPVTAVILLLFLTVSINAQTISPDRHRHGHRHGQGHGHVHWPMPTTRPPNSPVQLHASDQYVVLDNGNVEVTFNNPQGDVIGMRYGGIDNLLELNHPQSNRGYLDLVWNWPGEKGRYDRVDGTKFEIISQTEDTVEISFVRTWDNSNFAYASPLIIEKRYIMRRNVSGLYAYVTFEHPEGWPAFEIGQARVVFKLNGQKFHYMALSDQRQRVMPTEEDRQWGQPLAYKEAVLLTNPSNPELKGEVDDKYQYSGEADETRVHGWMSQDPRVGFWMINPSDEFHSGGPLKQELTNHVGPVVLNSFMTKHYVGRDIVTTFDEGEEWKKVFGPYMIYLNSDPRHHSSKSMWEDAKNRMAMETESWPYNFTRCEDYPHSSQRGTVSGQLLVRDRYMSGRDMPGGSAYVGLAAPGEAGSWQQEGKGYQFWTRADHHGRFVIKNVRPGVYNLYSWVPGFIGDYKYEGSIVISEGSEIRLDRLVFEPPRFGPTIWEIGIPNRKASEFYIPDPSPMLANKLYSNSKHDRFRQYGLWSRYSEIYPDRDPVYTIGESDHTKDWFFAHVTRDIGNSTFVPTTRTINFEHPARPLPWTRYRLYIAVASSQAARIQVRFNDPGRWRPQFTTRTAGWDNAIARHGIHGLYRLYSFDVPWYFLRQGTNRLYLTQPRAGTPFTGLMYDYIRFEGPIPMLRP